MSATYSFSIIECDVVDRGGHKMILFPLGRPPVFTSTVCGGSLGQHQVKNHLAHRSHSLANGHEPGTKAFRVVWHGKKPRGVKDWPSERMCW